MHKNFPCPCCGFLTMSESPQGTFDICPVCYWEDDLFQLKNIDYQGGANIESLREARGNFKKFGASSVAFIKYVRPPRQDEIP